MTERPGRGSGAVGSSAGLGVRACDTCGMRWQSRYGMLKDSGMLSSGRFGVMVDSANKAGLTCTQCSRSYCREHLGEPFPTNIPGGECPSCGSPLDLA